MHSRAVVIIVGMLACAGNMRGDDASGPPTFFQHIAPIAHFKCGECHRAGGQAPFPLATPRDWAEHRQQILAVLNHGTMPPWLPRGEWGEFQGDRRLTSEEQRLIRRWLASDMPAGDAAASFPLPAPNLAWRMGEPSATLIARPLVSHQLVHSPLLMVELPAEDRFVSGLEIRAAQGGFQRALVWLDLPFGTQATEFTEDDTDSPASLFQPMKMLRDRLSLKVGSPLRPVQRARAVEARDRRLLGVWTLDQPALALPPAHAFLFPARSRLILELDAPLANAEVEVGLHFAVNPPENLVLAAPLESPAAIRPAAGQESSTSNVFRVPVDTELFALAPLAPSACRDVRVSLTLPSGKTESLLWIDRWDARWTRAFLLPRPIQVPAGSRLEARYAFGPAPADIVAQTPESSASPALLTALLAPVQPARYDELARSIQQHQINVVRTPLVNRR